VHPVIEITSELIRVDRFHGVVHGSQSEDEKAMGEAPQGQQWTDI
jgi:hypothetical protein